MTYPKALATLDVILRLAKVRLYDQGRDTEHAHAGAVCAAMLHDLGLPVRFVRQQDGFRVEIENPTDFYEHTDVKSLLWEVPGDMHMSEVGGKNPTLMGFYNINHYRGSLTRTMGDPRELRLSSSAFTAFARAAESWRPANSDTAPSVRAAALA